MTVDVDSTAVEIGTDLEAHEPPAALFRTDDPVEVVEQATRVANALAAVIEGKGLFTMIQGKKHVRVEGWQLLGSMLGVTAVCVATDPVDGGYRATVEARTADGRVIGRADALCTKHEKRGPWKSADDYARLSMAQTRATSKALKGPLGFVVSLAGYATTPAEEMTFAEADPSPPVREATASDSPLTTAAQREAILEAAKGNLTVHALCDVLLAATGHADLEGVVPVDENAAALWLGKQLDRMPARFVPDVLKRIKAAS